MVGVARHAWEGAPCVAGNHSITFADASEGTHEIAKTRRSRRTKSCNSSNSSSPRIDRPGSITSLQLDRRGSFPQQGSELISALHSQLPRIAWGHKVPDHAADQPRNKSVPLQTEVSLGKAKAKLASVDRPPTSNGTLRYVWDANCDEAASKKVLGPRQIDLLEMLDQELKRDEAITWPQAEATTLWGASDAAPIGSIKHMRDAYWSEVRERLSESDPRDPSSDQGEIVAECSVRRVLGCSKPSDGDAGFAGDPAATDQPIRSRRLTVAMQRVVHQRSAHVLSSLWSCWKRSCSMMLR